MANNYYVFTPDFIPGQKVASAEMNSQLSGIESGFDALPGVANAIVKGVAYRGTEAGSGNSYTITMDDTRTAYADGDRVLFKATHTNTGASSINLDSIGLISLVLADSSATGASEILSGRFYEAVYVAASNHFQLTTPGAAATTTAALQVGYAEEWASKAEDSLVSTAAGGNGTTDYSSLHWAAKAAADVVLTNADVVATNADVVLTNADVVSTHADVVTTNADAATTTQDAIDTAADAVSTAADAVSTAADVITAAASETAAGISETNAGASETAAAASETAAGLSETAAALSETNAGVSETNAAASAASINLPTISGGDTDKILEVNVAEDGYDLVARAASETATGFVELATDAEIITGTDTARAVTPANVQHKLDTEYYTQTEADAGFAPITRGRKNLLRNGGLNIWQRGTSFAPIVHTAFSADGLQQVFTGVAACTITRQVSAAANNKDWHFYWDMDVTTADTSIGAGDYYQTVMKLEGTSVIALKMGKSGAKEFTLSFWTAHTIAGTYCVSFRNNTSARSYIAEYTQDVANTWQKQTITLTADTTGTWEYAPGATGLSVTWVWACGSTYQTPAGAWTAGNYIASSNQVNGVSSTANFCRLANLQLEVGGEATDFEYVEYGEDLSRAQRHYEDNVGTATAPVDGGAVHGYAGTAIGTTDVRISYDFKTPKMNSSYSTSFYRSASGGTAGQWSYYSSGWVDGVTTVGNTRVTGMRVKIVGSGLTIGDAHLTEGVWSVKNEL